MVAHFCLKVRERSEGGAINICLIHVILAFGVKCEKITDPLRLGVSLNKFVALD